MTTRRQLVAVGGLLGTGVVAGCVGRTPSSTTSTATNETEAEQSSAINDDTALRATLEIGSEEAQRVLFTSADIATVGAVSTGTRTGVTVPIELTEAGTDSVVETAAAVDLDTTYEQATITVRLDGERVNRFGINAPLAAAMASGEWSGEFVLTFTDEAAAESFHDRLIVESTA